MKPKELPIFPPEVDVCCGFPMEMLEQPTPPPEQARASQGPAIESIGPGALRRYILEQRKESKS